MILFWHQKDLRIDENWALYHAAKIDRNILPVFILSPNENLGAASKWWLHYSLEALSKEYQKRGVLMLFRIGDPVAVLTELLKESKSKKIYYNQTFEKDEKRVERALEKQAVPFNGNHLIYIPELLNKSGKPFTVFTPFYNALKKECVIKQGSPGSLRCNTSLSSLNLNDLALLPQVSWDSHMKRFWQPGREGALKRVIRFDGDSYDALRNIPSVSGTSFLSPHLHFGEVSISEVWRKVESDAFRRQLAWREFAGACIYHYPHTPYQNWKPKFDRFPWVNDREKFQKWKEGKTGYPIIDAAMRQLWKLGWMHNRLRMVVASFLVKNLMIPWEKGAEWFWDTLVDADLGNNTLGWQWVAGSGMDAAPFFRIFNPVLQGEKFDPNGLFVKSFCPELERCPKKWIHKPWEAPKEVLEEAGVFLGGNYPKPMVDCSASRKEALAAFKSIS